MSRCLLCPWHLGRVVISYFAECVSLIWGCWCFLMVRLKLCFFLARKPQKCCAFLSGYNMSTCLITVNSDHWIKVFTHFPPVMSLFFPLFITKYLVGRYPVSPHPQVLASIDDGPCLQHLLLPTLPNGDFLLFSILFINWNSTARKSCFFPPT